MANAQTDRLDALFIGYTDAVTRTIAADDVARFASLSGDYNALHMDEEFAVRTEFQERVVHGFLHASLLSTLVGMKIPGPGALYLSQSLDFTKAVFIGDTVEARGTIESLDKTTRILGIATTITNQRGEVVLKGRAEVKVLKLAEPKPTQPASILSAGGGLLAGKTALITGASRGIGRAIAVLFAAHGADVWINYRKSATAARALEAEILATGGKARAIAADILDPNQVSAMLAQISSAGPLDILINNAGPHIHSSPFDGVAWDDMRAAFDGVVGAMFHTTHAALPALKASKGTVITVVSSAALGRTAYNWAPYVTAKSALLGLCKNLAQELGPQGVRVNMVSPSLVETDLVAGVPDRMRQMMVGRTPLRRLATVDDVAGAVLLLASPYAAFITGDNLLVTGGEVMV